MAKGDPGQTDLSKTAAANTGTLNTQLGSNSKQLWDNYNAAAGTAKTDYNSIMNAYRNFGNPMGTPNAMGTGAAPPNYSSVNLGNAPADDNSVNAFLAAHGITDPAGQEYWRSHINSKSDGLQAGNAQYWSERITQGQAQNAGGGSGGPSYGGSINWNPQAYAGYQNFANGGGSIGWDPEFRGALSKALGGYGNFAETGGFSPQDIQDIRARAIGPTRSVYSSAQSNIDRARSLQGFSPNYTAATAKMARDLSSQISDANVNANASIAQMIQQGKLAGLQGLSSTGQGGQGLDSAMSEFNRNLQLSGLQGMTGIDEFGANLGLQMNQQELQRLAGMASLYSATPGQAALFGNQALTAQGQQLTGQSLQNQLAMGTPGFPWKETISGIGSGIGTAADVYSKYKGAQGAGAGAGAALSGATQAGQDAAFYGGSTAGIDAATSTALPTFAGAGGAGSAAAPGVVGTTGASVGSGTSAGGAVGAGAGSDALASLGGYAAGIGIPAAIMMGINKYTGGPSVYDTGGQGFLGLVGGGGGNIDPYGLQADMTTAQQLLATYGPESPIYTAFMAQHPWAGGGYGAPDLTDYSAVAGRQ